MSQKEEKNSTTGKNRLRGEIWMRLRGMGPEQRRQQSERAARHLYEWLREHPECQVIGTYCPLKLELDLMSVLDWLPERCWAFPRIEAEGKMAFYQMNGGENWMQGPMGLREPDPALAPLCEASALDLILVPSLGLTHEGRRLGKGGGYYDRFLPNLRKETPLIGVGFDEQVLDMLPLEEHDRNMSGILTPTGGVFLGKS